MRTRLRFAFRSKETTNLTNPKMKGKMTRKTDEQLRAEYEQWVDIILHSPERSLTMTTKSMRDRRLRMIALDIMRSTTTDAQAWELVNDHDRDLRDLIQDMLEQR